MLRECSVKRELSLHKVLGVQEIAESCLVCGKFNEHGYHAQFLNLDDDRVFVRMRPSEHLQSYPDRLHGGVISTLMDELLSRAIQARFPKVISVTLDLSLKFRTPVPYDSEIQGVAWVVKDRTRIYDAAGEIFLPDGTVAVQATGKFLKTDPDDLRGETDRIEFLTDERPFPEHVMA